MSVQQNLLESAPTDQPFRNDISRLKRLVSEMLAEQLSPDFVREVEHLRGLAVRREEQAEQNAALNGELRGLSPEHAEMLIKAFSAYFHVINIAERVHRIRRHRDYQYTENHTPQPDSLLDAMQKLRAGDVTAEELRGWLPLMHIEPVFTAHPTEALRRAILEKERTLVSCLFREIEGKLTPAEYQINMARLLQTLTSSWQTAVAPPNRPTVDDEREHVSFYLTEFIYAIIPVFYEALEQAINSTWGTKIPLPRLLSFGTWVGGDMDGNPNVNATTITATLAAQRRSIINAYLKEIGQLERSLTQSEGVADFSRELQQKITAYHQQYPEAAQQAEAQYSDMPYRILFNFIRQRLHYTLANRRDGYAGPEEFLQDVRLVADSLSRNRGEHAGLFLVKRFICRINTFGFHMARLDIRQESSVHAQAVSAVLPEFNTDLPVEEQAALLAPYASGNDMLPDSTEETGQALDAVFRALQQARTNHGRDSLGVYIISMAHHRADMLTVLALAHRAGLCDENRHVPLDIVPLFETVDDLKRCPQTMRDLLADPIYREHLQARGNTQMIMLGYSDSGKDGGIAASRWRLQRAQVELLAIAGEFSVTISFFHGRGGSASRGGGKTSRAVMASPRGSIGGTLRVTEQGEVIHRKYGIRALALRSLEQTVSSAFIATLRPRLPDPREARWREVMDVLTTASTQAYHRFVDAPDFMNYFRQATPIDVIERMTLGSRPSRRLGQDAALSNLRAIPWVFAWNQNRAIMPGWYGVGSGLKVAVDQFGADTLTEMARDWPFFRTFLDDISMVLGKSDLGIAGLFSQLSGQLHDRFFPLLCDEFDLTKHWVLTLLGDQWLLQHDPRLALSIHHRNPYLDPMSILQMDLLKRWRATECQDEALLRALFISVNGISQGIQNTG